MPAAASAHLLGTSSFGCRKRHIQWPMRCPGSCEYTPWLNNTEIAPWHLSQHIPIIKQQHRCIFYFFLNGTGYSVFSFFDNSKSLPLHGSLKLWELLQSSLIRSLSNSFLSWKVVKIQIYTKSSFLGIQDNIEISQQRQTVHRVPLYVHGSQNPPPTWKSFFQLGSTPSPKALLSPCLSQAASRWTAPSSSTSFCPPPI